MVTVHKVPVIDDKGEFNKFEEFENRYAEAVEDYADSMFFYKDILEEGEPVSRTVEYAVEKLGNSYKELRREERKLNGFLEDSSIREHTSQPGLDKETIDRLEKDYNLNIRDLMQEDPSTFYFNFAKNYIEKEYTEWEVKTNEVSNIPQLVSLAKRCIDQTEYRFEIQKDTLPETSPSSLVVNPKLFENVAALHEKASDRRLYEHISSLEPRVYREYNVSVMEELWGLEMSSGIINQIESSDDFMRASEL